MNTLQLIQVTKINRMKSVDFIRMYKRLSAKQTNNQTNKQLYRSPTPHQHWEHLMLIPKQKVTNFESGLAWFSQLLSCYKPR